MYRDKSRTLNYSYVTSFMLWWKPGGRSVCLDAIEQGDDGGEQSCLRTPAFWGNSSSVWGRLELEGSTWGEKRLKSGEKGPLGQGMGPQNAAPSLLHWLMYVNVLKRVYKHIILSVHCKYSLCLYWDALLHQQNLSLNLLTEGYKRNMMTLMNMQHVYTEFCRFYL